MSNSVYYVDLPEPLSACSVTHYSNYYQRINLFEQTWDFVVIFMSSCGYVGELLQQ